MPGTLSDILPLAIKNPSRAAATRLLSISDQGEVRGVVDPDTRDLLIWKATEAAHRQIAESIRQGVINRASPFLLRTWEQIDGHSRSGHASG